MLGRGGSWPALLFGIVGVAVAGCSSTPEEPFNPAWADVAPIFRGECNGCHGWNAGQTGGGYRFDFFDTDGCGDAALALKNLTLAGSPIDPSTGFPYAAPKIVQDVVRQPGASWPRMPPQPSPALPDWESGALWRWAQRPAKGPPPSGNRPPAITTYGLPAVAGTTLSFTAVIDDPDGDSAIGVIEAGGFGFLMNRPGSFNVSFDTSQWAAGPTAMKAVLCDGWGGAGTTTIPLGSVQIRH
jgi:hypothetical protein